MRQRLAPIVGLLLSASLVLPASVAAAAPAPSEHDRIVAHWTPARMAAAVPRDFVRDAEGRFSLKGKPGGGGGAVTGASWAGGGPIVTGSGKVYFEMGGGAWICSGSVVREGNSGYSLVMTAGHCAIDETTREFATNWMFIPDFDAIPTYDCQASQYGCWTSIGLYVNSGFANAGGFNTQATTYDWAFAVVGSGGLSDTQLDATVGSFGISYTAAYNKGTVDAFGYPAAGKYHGSDLTYCAGATFKDTANASKTLGLACDMTGGSSGGPWLTGFSNGSGTLNSLNSYGYSGVRNMYGPIFNNKTQATFDAAVKAMAGSKVNDTIVP